MKRSLNLVILSFVAQLAIAQNYDAIKTVHTLGQNQKAKEDLDKNMSNTKFASKPEAWILKSSVYGALANEGVNKNDAGAAALLQEADDAFQKYRQMDPEMALLKEDPIYQQGPVNIYSAYYTLGYNDYNAKNYQPGYEKFKKVVAISDELIKFKILNLSIDTNALVLGGLLAELSKNNEDAARFYSRLADIKIPGEDYEGIYRFLVNHYFAKKELDSFEKFKKLGAELYPKSEYFTYDKVDFAVGLAPDFTEKLKAVEEVLAQDPDNFKANEILGEIIFDTLNSSKEGAILPSNADELEQRMVKAFQKAAAARPGYENPVLFIGDHFISKAVRINEARVSHATDMKSRTKPGQPNSKEDIAKRDKLDKEYGDALELARDPYEQAAKIYATKEKLELRDKQHYKKVANYLAEIYAFKKAQAKGKTADQAKYAAEEKKWNDLYETIK